MIRVDETKLGILHSFDLTPTTLKEMDLLYVFGFPIKDNIQASCPIQSEGLCKKILGRQKYYRAMIIYDL